VDVAVVLEATPLSFAWPLLLALLLQVLLAAVSGVVWWARGVVWPINCGYPETTTGRGPCHNDGEGTPTGSCRGALDQEDQTDAGGEAGHNPGQIGRPAVVDVAVLGWP
jgi:hypothetical protein